MDASLLFERRLDDVLEDTFRYRPHREVHNLAFFVDEDGWDGFDSCQIYYVRRLRRRGLHRADGLHPPADALRFDVMTAALPRFK